LNKLPAILLKNNVKPRYLSLDMTMVEQSCQHCEFLIVVGSELNLSLLFLFKQVHMESECDVAVDELTARGEANLQS
jgi:16S rRNA G527 N7-methylase RsmG